MRLREVEVMAAQKALTPGSGLNVGVLAHDKRVFRHHVAHPGAGKAAPLKS